MKIKGYIQYIVDKLQKLPQDIQFNITIEECKKKRSINQNDYYWTLIDKFANYENCSKIKLHNEMLARYGQAQIGVYVVVDDDTITEEYSDVHLRKTSKTFIGKDKKTYRYYQLMRGSSTYNTKEMSILIDGLITEIQGSEAPIDTLTYTERERLWGQWE